MYSLFLAILASCCLLSLFTGRYVLSLILLIGFLQDPFRKLVEGEPIVFVVFVGVLFACAFFGLLLRIGVNRSTAPFVEWTSNIKLPLTLFFLLLVIQLLHSLIRYGSPVVGVIGLVSYAAPFLAIIVGYYSINSIEDIRRFMKQYIVVGIIVVVSVFLAFLGYDWLVFKEVGEGIKIYDQGTVLKSFPGLMRTGEIAAWHIATTGCFFIIIMMTSSNKRNSSWVTFLIVLVLMLVLAAVVVTGRRKMLMLVSLFCIFYSLGYFYYRKSIDFKYIVSAFTVSICMWFGLEVLFPGGYGSSFENYLLRGESVYLDATDRAYDLGLNPVVWAYNRTGLFGGGLGIASQGGAQFGASSIAGGSGEGGLGKIMVELGLPGFIIIFWLLAAIVNYIIRILALSSSVMASKRLLPLVLGLSVMLMVNALTFTIATQLYGDIFILLLLGLQAGFLFALPKLVASGELAENT